MNYETIVIPPPIREKLLETVKFNLSKDPIDIREYDDECVHTLLTPKGVELVRAITDEYKIDIRYDPTVRLIEYNFNGEVPYTLPSHNDTARKTILIYLYRDPLIDEEFEICDSSPINDTGPIVIANGKKLTRSKVGEMGV